MPITFIALIIIALMLFGLVVFVLSRYQRCPSDKILVIYGKVGSNRSARCSHGGASFVWPLFQAYEYLDLTPMTIEIDLKKALSKQNIRIDVPASFTVGISNEEGIMDNAAERLLGLPAQRIIDLARDIIYGQLRLVIATMTIEEINADRDTFLSNVAREVGTELRKIGLSLINVNITDIKDESGYIEALGREAAAKAVNEAKRKVAEADRDGEVGSAEAFRDQRIRTAKANAAAVEGENSAAVSIAQSLAERRSKEAESQRIGEAAEKVATAKALEESYHAEKKAESSRAEREKATKYANVITSAEIEKERIMVEAQATKERKTIEAEGEAARITINAEAEAQQRRILAKGEADGLLARMQAEAQGSLEVLAKKAEGIRQLVASCGGRPQDAALLMITEQLPEIIQEQVKAISQLKIDKVVVWDSMNGDGTPSTAKFLSGMVNALPPIHELARMAGLNLPEILGNSMTDEEPSDHGAVDGE
ncbi:flotillin family protein [bacterium]|nr:flotillin family protein [candidate division CSSED10-310 bacterium]